MLVFIDESGDPGFKLHQGSSPLFVTSMVIFGCNDHALEAQEKISSLQQRLGVRPEFKFNKLYSPYKDEFFAAVAPCQFKTRFVVVRKELIRSHALRTVNETFYKFFIRHLIQYHGGTLRDAKVIIDGSGDRDFKRAFQRYLKRHIGPDYVKGVVLKDSKKDPLLQLADMSAGAIARSYRTDRKEPDRWRNQLSQSGKIQNVWEFR